MAQRMWMELKQLEKINFKNKQVEKRWLKL
jgi:hypothetical protein